MKNCIVVLSFVLILETDAAPFKNLGFETPSFPDFIGQRIPGPPLSSAPVEWVTPGWTMPVVGYNVSQQFAGVASLLDANFRDTHFGQSAKRPVVGNYSLGIWPGSGPISPDGATFPFTLRQTGDVPSDALSLQFLYLGSDLKIFIGGTERPLHRIADRPSGDSELGPLPYFAVDVGLWAGQTTELRFEFRSHGYDDFGEIPRRPFEPNAQMHVLDDLSFSPLPAVPEPQTWALFGVGLGAVLWFGRKRA